MNERVPLLTKKTTINPAIGLGPFTGLGHGIAYDLYAECMSAYIFLIAGTMQSRLLCVPLCMRAAIECNNVLLCPLMRTAIYIILPAIASPPSMPTSFFMVGLRLKNVPHVYVA